MDERFIFMLKNPCKNRGLDLINNGNGTITINGKLLDTIKETEDYLMEFPRVNG